MNWIIKLAWAIGELEPIVTQHISLRTRIEQTLGFVIGSIGIGARGYRAEPTNRAYVAQIVLSRNTSAEVDLAILPIKVRIPSVAYAAAQ